MGPAAADALPFGDDVQPAPLPQFQGGHLANDAFPFPLSRDRGRAPFYRAQLRMDARGSVPCLSALRIGAALGIENLAARDRRGDWRTTAIRDRGGIPGNYRLSWARISGSRTSAQSPVISSARTFFPARARSRRASVNSYSPRGDGRSFAM